jgi:hypothetical protein
VRYSVEVGSVLAERIAAEYEPERLAAGAPSEWDFWSGPLAAALLRFRDFESLHFEHTPDVRYAHIVDPVFGVLVFVGVLVGPNGVELAAFDVDPDYWQRVSEEPDD